MKDLTCLEKYRLREDEKRIYGCVEDSGNIEVEVESAVPVVELQALRDALSFNGQITEAGLANLDSLIERYRNG